MLERIVVKQVDIRGYRWYFQWEVDLPQLSFARIDVAVWGTGISSPLAIEPQGSFWHDRNDESDFIREAQLLSAGIKLVQIWEQDLLGTVERMNFAIEEALQGRELPQPVDFGISSFETEFPERA